jgi:hypothetical protein
MLEREEPETHNSDVFVGGRREGRREGEYLHSC